MKKNFHNYRSNLGLSVIELMVALAIVSILLAGVTTIYRASKTSYNLNDEVAEIQENARFAFHNLTRDIRMAGYTGCSHIRYMHPDEQLNIITKGLIVPEGFQDGLTANTFIRGHTSLNKNWTESGMRTPPLSWDKKSDGISVMKVSACSAGLSEVAQPGGIVKLTPNNCDFEVGDAVLLTDCAGAEIFTISLVDADGSIHHLPKHNIAPAKLSRSYDTKANVFKLERQTYYVGTVTAVDGTTTQGLIRSSYKKQAEETILQEELLIPNVSDLKVSFGLDLTNNNLIDSRKGGSFEYTTEEVDSLPLSALEQRDPLEDSAWSRVKTVFLTYTIVQNQGTDAVTTKTQVEKTFSTAINLRNNSF